MPEWFFNSLILTGITVILLYPSSLSLERFFPWCRIVLFDNVGSETIGKTGYALTAFNYWRIPMSENTASDSKSHHTDDYNEEPELERLRKLMQFDAANENYEEFDDYASQDEFNFWL
jgi:hypothetical protein